tara:strand:+ start:169 stop:1044 length:876 start_codon:yes stop_codon:yes gene_type:complete
VVDRTLNWHERSGKLGVGIALNAIVLHREVTHFQTIEVLEHQDFGRILTLDGYIQACQADEFIYHEMAVHVPLLGCNKGNVSVLIIGGGDGGILREVLVHNFVASVTMVEIDERVIELSNQYLGIEGNYSDPRVNLVIKDASQFVDDAINDNTLFDLIILDLTEPVGPSANLFTESFVKNLSGLLTSTGVIVDSDSIFLSTSGGHFLQEESSGGENLYNLIQRTKLLSHIDIYRSYIPFFPGADFVFFLYGRSDISLRQPFKKFLGRHYDSEIHRAAFILPTWQRDWLLNI